MEISSEQVKGVGLLHDMVLLWWSTEVFWLTTLNTVKHLSKRLDITVLVMYSLPL